MPCKHLLGEKFDKCRTREHSFNTYLEKKKQVQNSGIAFNTYPEENEVSVEREISLSPLIYEKEKRGIAFNTCDAPLNMPAAGVEPALPLGERDFKSRASANSVMPACKKYGLFVDRSVYRSRFICSRNLRIRSL